MTPRRPRRRNLKSQIQRDAKRVYMNLDEFATLEHIRYWKNRNGPPVDMRIAIVTDEDGNMNAVWNTLKDQQRVSHDQTLFQMEKVFFCAREDFDPIPKKNRRIQIGDGAICQVLGVEVEGGLLRVEVRELEE